MTKESDKHYEYLKTYIAQIAMLEFIKDNNYSIKLQYGAFKDRPYDSKAIWGNDQKIKKIISMRQSNEKI